MLSTLIATTQGFAPPAALAIPSPVSLRTSTTLMQTRKERKEAAMEPEKAAMEPEKADGIAPPVDMAGVVVPTSGATKESSKLPPIAGSSKAFAAKAALRTKWNPNGLDVAMLPAPLRAQFVTQYLNTAPTYLDGSMPGDFGFDPWGLVALASPTAETDKFARTAEDRDAKMLSMAPEEQQQALKWMRESEIKHARLAMLAAAGWPLAELYSGEGLHDVTNGRAPSLFNGQLLEFFPALVLVFGPIAYLEFQNKDKLPEGDYGFDPLGIAGEQRPYGAFPFDSFLGNTTPLDGVRYAKDMDALKLAEIKNRRLAMMAITGMAVQEFVWGSPVVQQTPFFFGR
jgi:light-harvesting complex II chlorophyll a/b binding protein 4